MPESATLAEEVVAVVERTDIHERVVVSPAAGRFAPFPADVVTAEGEWVEVDQVLARVVSGSSESDVRSAFAGWLMGMLAVPGQPVRAGEALFWIWSS